jgi:hypothetical protein
MVLVLVNLGNEEEFNQIHPFSSAGDLSIEFNQKKDILSDLQYFSRK